MTEDVRNRVKEFIKSGQADEMLASREESRKLAMLALEQAENPLKPWAADIKRLQARIQGLEILLFGVAKSVSEFVDAVTKSSEALDNSQQKPTNVKDVD